MEATWAGKVRSWTAPMASSAMVRGSIGVFKGASLGANEFDSRFLDFSLWGSLSRLDLELICAVVVWSICAGSWLKFLSQARRSLLQGLHLDLARDH
jgi:hypothetical protein